MEKKNKTGRKTTSVTINAEKLKTVMLEKPLNQGQLAYKTGYSRESINRAINKQWMDITLLDKICECLDVSPKYITDEIEKYSMFADIYAGIELRKKYTDKELLDMKKEFERSGKYGNIFCWHIPTYKESQFENLYKNLENDINAAFINFLRNIYKYPNFDFIESFPPSEKLEQIIQNHYGKIINGMGYDLLTDVIDFINEWLIENDLWKPPYFDTDEETDNYYRTESAKRLKHFTEEKEEKK